MHRYGLNRRGNDRRKETIKFHIEGLKKVEGSRAQLQPITVLFTLPELCFLQKVMWREVTTALISPSSICMARTTGFLDYSMYLIKSDSLGMMYNTVAN